MDEVRKEIIQSFIDEEKLKQLEGPGEQPITASFLERRKSSNSYVVVDVPSIDEV